MQFIGDLSRTIFGTATVEDLQRVAGKVNAIIERGNSLGEAMVQHEKNFESYMETNNHRVSELRQVVLNNHGEIVEVHNEAMSSINDSKEYAYANTDAIRHLNATMNMIMHLREVSESIRSMSRGVFPQHLLSDAQLKMAIRNIKKMVRRSDPNFSVLHPDPDYFHKFGSFVAFLSKDSNIWITLKIPVGLKTEGSRIYRIDTYPVPVGNDTDHLTRIEGLPEYIMLQGSSTDGQVMYAPISRAELIECSKKGEYLCKFGLKFIDIRSTTCIAAIVNDDPDLIHDTCDFRFYRNQFRPGFVPVSNSELLFYNVDKVEIECGKNKRYSEVGCTFCLFHFPCNCKVTFGLESYSTFLKKVVQT